MSELVFEVELKPYVEKEPTMFESFRPASNMCFYAARTTWWTTDAEDLYSLPTGLPCDPRGSVLLQGETVTFLSTAMEDAGRRYGKHGLRAFMATHHGVIVIERDGVPVPWSVQSWDEVNRLLDAFDLVNAARADGTAKRESDGNKGPTVH